MKSSTLKTKSFNFKHFAIEGGQTGMPVSTDGVLLGAWANLSHSQSMLDIGTGTGLLALMAAQRNDALHVTAVDIDDHAIEAAQHNFSQSPWSERIQLIQGDILQLNLADAFDSIICNPPYFNNGEQAKHQQRATARHTDTLNHQSLILECLKLTSENATANFILPTVEGEAFIESALQSSWFLARRLDVKPTETKPANRILFELAKQPTKTQYDQLTIRDKSGYTDDFIALTKDFYLKM